MGIWNMFKKSVNDKEIRNDSLDEIIKNTIHLMESCDDLKSETKFIN